MGKYDSFSQDQLKAELAKLQELLESTLEEKEMVLGQEGVHLAFGTIERFEDDIKAINIEIANVKDLIK
jgi:hypothetical protein